jgi:Concanavalin A-like lectin/glucanases superfamily
MGKAASRLCAIAVPAALAMPASGPPLARWPLDEGAGQVAADRSGHDHDGRLGALPGPDGHDPAWVSGRLGAALRFDGANQQYVTVPASPALASPRVSVTAWVRRLGTPGEFRYVLSAGATACHSAPYGLYSGSNGGIGFYVSNAMRFVVSPRAEPTQVWDGDWHHAAGTYDGRQVRLYLDGHEVGGGAPSDIAIAYGSAANGLYVGSYRGSCELPFTGDIDEVAIHDRALGPGEIRNEADRIARTAPPPQQPPVTGPPAGAPRRTTTCLRITIRPRRLVAGRRSLLRLRVRGSGGPAAGVSISVRGFKLAKRARTGPKGSVRLRVRPRRRGKLRVRVVGQGRACASGVVTVARR